MEIKNEASAQLINPVDSGPKYLEGQTFLQKIFKGGKLKKILLVNTADASNELFQIDTAKRHRYTNYPPYGLSVLAGQLKSVGAEVNILNLNHVVIKEAVKAIDSASFAFLRESDNSFRSFVQVVNQ